MGAAAKIRILLVKRHMKVKDLAEKLGSAPSNLSNKLTRDNFSEKELLEIANALDCNYDSTFTMKDTGEKV